VGVINRPETSFDGPAHVYTDGEGQRLYGVSSVAKIGEAEDSFSIGSAWGFRVGYEGAWELATADDDDLWNHCATAGDLRAALQVRGLTPWANRDKAAARGNWAHDLLEALANTSRVTADVFNGMDAEHQGHGRAILQWYLDYRPSFVATEVQVTSVQHGFAGRYDIRCRITDQALRKHGIVVPDLHGPLIALGLVDLKTSKRIYPTSHFVQLEGYEMASVEMGFPPTHFRAVLNTHADGTYDFELGYARGEDFLAYLGALRSIRWIKDQDPEVKAKRALEGALVAALPAKSRDLAGRDGFPATAKEIGRIFGGLRKSGVVAQDEKTKVWFSPPDSETSAQD
jgi:hypothetical protein